MIDEFRKQNEGEIEKIHATPRLIDDVLAGIDREVQYLERETNKDGLLLRIEENLNLDEAVEDRDKKSVLKGRIEAMKQKISQNQKIIKNLQELRECLFATTKG